MVGVWVKDGTRKAPRAQLVKDACEVLRKRRRLWSLAIHVDAPGNQMLNSDHVGIAEGAALGDQERAVSRESVFGRERS